MTTSTREDAQAEFRKKLPEMTMEELRQHISNAIDVHKLMMRWQQQGATRSPSVQAMMEDALQLADDVGFEIARRERGPGKMFRIGQVQVQPHSSGYDATVLAIQQNYNGYTSDVCLPMVSAKSKDDARRLALEAAAQVFQEALDQINAMLNYQPDEEKLP